MCLYPKLIKNRRYTANKKNKGIIPEITDERMKFVPIGCQECMECRKQKARGWQVRLLEDVKANKNGKFITLTFSNESIKKLSNEIENIEGYQLDNAIAILAMRKFNERWRKKYGVAIRHWMVTEIGHHGTENIHIHGIMWTDKTTKDIEDKWQYGWVWKGKKKNGELINYVNEKTVNYIVKYIHKIDEQHKTFKSKILTSPGIGSNYTRGYNYKKNTFNGDKTIETYRTRTGHKISMPIYWRNKIYTENERQMLWIQRLDKNERWVCGERIDISKGETQYWKILKWYQDINTTMGYGNDTTNWERKIYEKERRAMMMKVRTEEKKTYKEKPAFLSEQKTTTITIGNSLWEITEEGMRCLN